MTTTRDDAALLPAAVTALTGADDPEARRRLARMKRVAGGLLAASAAVFVATLLLPETTAVGFVRAAAEAAMVGGLADWFAVTALFRHPLGLRVPHTALIPRQKDQLATKLGEFVTGNFLTPDVVAGHVAEARLVHRAGERLADEKAAGAIAAEVATTAAAVLGSLDARHVGDYVLELARRDVHRRSYSPVLGSFLAAAVRGRGQQPLVDVVVRNAHSYLREHREELLPQLKTFIERNGLGARMWASDKRVGRLIDHAIEWLEAMHEQGAAHPTRRWLDAMLAQLADDLQHNHATIDALDAQLRVLVDDERLAELTQRLVADVLASVRDSLRDRHDDLQTRLTRLVQDAGERIVTDDEFAGRLEATLERAVRHVVAQYGDQVVRLIQQTVSRWEARDASDRIEVAVGRDLQCIRINGTLVGAVAGVVIHTVAVALS